MELPILEKIVKILKGYINMEFNTNTNKIKHIIGILSAITCLTITDQQLSSLFLTIYMMYTIWFYSYIIEQHQPQKNKITNILIKLITLTAITLIIIFLKKLTLLQTAYIAIGSLISDITIFYIYYFFFKNKNFSINKLILTFGILCLILGVIAELMLNDPKLEEIAAKGIGGTLSWLLTYVTTKTYLAIFSVIFFLGTIYQFYLFFNLSYNYFH